VLEVGHVWTQGNVWRLLMGDGTTNSCRPFARKDNIWPNKMLYNLHLNKQLITISQSREYWRSIWYMIQHLLKVQHLVSDVVNNKTRDLVAARPVAFNLLPLTFRL
jgi:hypothetical protein